MSTKFRHQRRQPQPSTHPDATNLPSNAGSRVSEAFFSLSPFLATHPKNSARNPFPCHTSKSKGLKVLKVLLFATHTKPGGEIFRACDTSRTCWHTHLHPSTPLFSMAYFTVGCTPPGIPPQRKERQSRGEDPVPARTTPPDHCGSGHKVPESDHRPELF